MEKRLMYIQPKIKNLLVDTENLAGLPASGPDDPSVGAKEMDAFDDAPDKTEMFPVKQRSVWDE
ncbi:MAG: hypothetical protein IKW98_11850 [Prevotella sp.]|nr:hypothetical protein [Prevotella sp.]